MTAVGLLIAVSGCGDSAPDRVLTAEELAGALPAGDSAPGGLELTEEPETDDEEMSRADVESAIQSSIEAFQEESDEARAQEDEIEGAGECAEAIDDRIEAFQQTLDDLPDDIDYRRSTADAVYTHTSGAQVLVYTYSAHPDTWPESETWLAESLACMTVEGERRELADEIEEVSSGDTMGYQARLIDSFTVWQTVLYRGSGYLQTDVVIEGDDPVDDDLSADVEALLDHIEEQGEAIDG